MHIFHHFRVGVEFVDQWRIICGEFSEEEAGRFKNDVHDWGRHFDEKERREKPANRLAGFSRRCASFEMTFFLLCYQSFHFFYHLLQITCILPTGCGEGLLAATAALDQTGYLLFNDLW